MRRCIHTLYKSLLSSKAAPHGAGTYCRHFGNVLWDFFCNTYDDDMKIINLNLVNNCPLSFEVVFGTCLNSLVRMTIEKEFYMHNKEVLCQIQLFCKIWKAYCVKTEKGFVNCNH